MLIKVEEIWVDPEQVEAIVPHGTKNECCRINLKIGVCAVLNMTADAAAEAINRALSRTAPNGQNDGLVVLSLLEKMHLKSAIVNRCRWVARDSQGLVFAFERRPEKLNGLWDCKGGFVMALDEGLFHFLRWEDPEPSYIPLLLGWGDITP